MAIETHCPNGHLVSADESLAGKTGFCPRCHAKVFVPAAGEPEAASLANESVLQDTRHDRVAAETGSNPFGVSAAAKKGKLCVACGNIASRSFTVCPRCATPLVSYRRLNVRKEREGVVVGFVDRQLRDDATIGQIAEELSGLADRINQQPLVLDFTGVAGVSSVMIGKLIMLQTKMKKTRGDLRLRHLAPEVRQVFAIAHLDRNFQIEEAAALA